MEAIFFPVATTTLTPLDVLSRLVFAQRLSDLFSATRTWSSVACYWSMLRVRASNTFTLYRPYNIVKFMLYTEFAPARMYITSKTIQFTPC